MPTTEFGFEDVHDISGQELLVTYGPTLAVEIGFDPGFPDDKPRPDLPANQIRALVDTGATHSCIDSDLALELGLPIVEREYIAGVHGVAPVNMHLAQIYIPALDHTIVGRFAGIHLSASSQTHLALLGRTFLQHYTMVYEGRIGRGAITNDT